MLFFKTLQTFDDTFPELRAICQDVKDVIEVLCLLQFVLAAFEDQSFVEDIGFW